MKNNAETLAERIGTSVERGQNLEISYTSVVFIEFYEVERIGTYQNVI